MLKFLTVSATVLAAGANAAAAPKVTSYPITNGCQSFPGYGSGDNANVTSPFLLQFTNTVAPVNNFGVIPLNYYVENNGRFALPGSNDLAKQTFRCSEAYKTATKNAPVLEARLSNGSWLPAQIFGLGGQNDSNGQLVVGARSNYSQVAQLYHHDSSGAGPIFIGGSGASTTWATQVEFLSDDVHEGFYYMRWIPSGGKIDPSEFSGYLQVWN